MFEKIKEDFWSYVFQMVLTILGLIAFSAYTNHNSKIDGFATADYVDSENKQQDIVCKETKEELIKDIDELKITKADNDVMVLVIKQLDRIETKLDKSIDNK